MAKRKNRGLGKDGAVDWVSINEVSLNPAMRKHLETARELRKQSTAEQGRFEAAFLKAAEAVKKVHPGSGEPITAENTAFGYNFGKLVFGQVEPSEGSSNAGAFSL